MLHHLKEQLGANSKIFFDIEAIPPGIHFDERVKAELAHSDVLLVVIGPRWR